MTDSVSPNPAAGAEPAPQEWHNRAVGALRGAEVRLTNGAAGAVIGQDQASVSNGATGVALAGNRLEITNGGGSLFLAGNSIDLQNGGGAAFLAGNSINIRNGGGALLAAGRSAHVERGFIAILLTPHAELQAAVRVLLNTPQALALGAALGLVLAVAGRLLRR